VAIDEVKVPADYNFELNFEFLTRSSREILHVVDDGTIYKALRIDNHPVLIRLKPSGRKFQVSYPAKTPAAATRKAVCLYVREWFDLDNDLTGFYDLAARDPLLKNVVKKFYGYRIVGLPDLFESLCWAVIGQQINLTFAYTLKQRFVEKFGDRIEWKGREYFLFPTAEVIAVLTDEDLLALQFSRQKSKYVRLIAQAFVDGVLSRQSISSLPFPEARQQLMSIKGVGNWTANYALMKTFRYSQAFPLEDAGLHNAIKNLKGLPGKPSVEQVKRIFRKYKGWEAYATLYFWKSL
jgi:DNA-3-methyladenine glycosylase II